MQYMISSISISSDDLLWDDEARISYLATIHSGKRSIPILKSSVTTFFNTKVSHIIFDENKAVGVVAYDPVGRLFTIQPEYGGEIILCCGVVETPRILYSSGFYSDLPTREPSDDNVHCHRYSNDFKYLPSLGSNLRDHLLLPFAAIGNWWIPLDDSSSAKTCAAMLWDVFLLCALACLGYNPPLPKPAATSTLIASANEDVGVHSDGCLNGVHGWFCLDAEGLEIDKNSDAVPW